MHQKRANLPGLGNFANKTLNFFESTRRPGALLTKFLEKPSHFN
jgi:hypothetical protein